MARMVLTAIGAATIYVAAGEAGSAQELADFGRGICTSALAGNLQAVDGAYYRKAIKAAGQTQESYCSCVSEVFEVNFAAQSERMMAKDANETTVMLGIITENLGACLDHGDGPDVAEIDLSEEINGCNMLLDDAISAPGFRADKVLAQMKKAKISREKICQCAAEDLSLKSDEMNADIANAPSPGQRWGQYLAGAVERCLKKG